MTNKIIWAVDVFQEDVSLEKKSAEMVKRMREALDATVTPVFVLSPIPFVFHPSISTPSRRGYRAERQDLEKRLAYTMNALGVESVEPCEVILSRSPSVRSEAEALIKFAQKEKASLIVLSSHARKGVERFFMGSFAETLLLQSPVPVLLVNPQTKLSSKVTDIIFPTDFSDKSKQALREVVTLAKATSATVQLFHHLEFMTPAYRDIDLPSASRMERLMHEREGEMKREKAKQGKEWVERLKTQKVKAKFTLDARPLYTVDAVLSFVAKFKGGLVALTSQSDAGIMEVLGGIARRVARKAEIPVWVVHPGKAKG